MAIGGDLGGSVGNIGYTSESHGVLKPEILGTNYQLEGTSIKIYDGNEVLANIINTDFLNSEYGLCSHNCQDFIDATRPEPIAILRGNVK